MKKNSLKIAFIFLCIIVITGVIYAATIKYSYPAETVLAETNFYGGAVPDLAADQAYDYTSDIDLETNGYFGMWLFLEHDSSGTTDDIVISYFASYDVTNYDDVALWTVTVTSDVIDDQISFLVFPEPTHGRIVVKTT